MKRVAYICIVAILAMGCAQYQVNRASKAYKERLDPLLGKSQQDVVMVMGSPASTEVIAGVEVWHYFQSYGQRGSVNVTPSEYSSYGSGKTWEAYDKIDVFFKDGIMVNWKGYVQR